MNMQRMVHHQRRGHVDASPVLDLVSQVKLKNSNVVNEASQRYLQMDINAGPAPEHVKVTFYTITRLFRNENDPNIRVVWNSLDPETRPETPAALYLLSLEDSEYLTQSLFKLLRTEKYDYFTTLMIGNSLMTTLSPNFLESLQAILDNQGAYHNAISLTEFIQLYPQLATANPFDLQRFWKMNPGHYMFGYSLFFTLIGKALNANNYQGWMTQRTRSFSRPLGLSEKDPKFAVLRPTLTVCYNFYTEVKTFWEIRALYFGTLWSMSKSSDLRAQGCRVSIALLRNAEMTNFSMILMWIISINEILMGWQELNKYHPYICAAYSKYQQMGDMAPWGKLILPPNEMTEFAAEKLIVPFSVARALSAKYGSATANQIEGVNKNSAVERIVTHALKIVSVAGGARTIDAMAVRAWKLDGYENKELVKLLDQGALEGEMIEEPEQGADVENRI
ncbi:MAG: hypothetical protein FuLiV2_gp1 [Hangzhou lispivirus 1]|uniref:Nucleoprotein n=1 Tax=Hangzhou lispivirus 1 TaxID=2905568 RepID=A0A8K1XG57_9MONO|nr:MAG: hypothetical protein FuLiV2_gp1 [Hangzhou lispivirus 1]